MKKLLIALILLSGCASGKQSFNWAGFAQAYSGALERQGYMTPHYEQAPQLSTKKCSYGELGALICE
jgi:hypothetical protein